MRTVAEGGELIEGAIELATIGGFVTVGVALNVVAAKGAEGERGAEGAGAGVPFIPVADSVNWRDISRLKSMD